MNRVIKKIIVLSMLVLLVSTITYLFVDKGSFAIDWQSKLDSQTSASSSSEVVTKTKSISGAAITIAQVIGVGIAVIMLIVLAMKYMTSAPSDRAEIKKHMVVYVIGAVVMFSAVGILQIIKALAASVN